MVLTLLNNIYTLFSIQHLTIAEIVNHPQYFTLYGSLRGHVLNTHILYRHDAC